MKNNTKLILGVLAGVAAGFAVGVMLAPKKGSEFRDDILGSFEDLHDRVTDLIEEGREKLSELGGFNENELDLPGTTGMSSRN